MSPRNDRPLAPGDEVRLNTARQTAKVNASITGAHWLDGPLDREKARPGSFPPRWVKIMKRWRRMNATWDEVLSLIDYMKRNAEQHTAKVRTET